MNILQAIIDFFWMFRKKPKESKPENNEGENNMSEETNTAPAIVPKREKRALLVGINKYRIPAANLNGCVNDVEDIYHLLTTTYDFKPDNIRVIVDERATKAEIEKRYKWILSSTKENDEALIYHSGHGSQWRDRSGDELSDKLDEILITHDHTWRDPLTDDVIGEYFKQLVKGAYLTMIVDACHSGTITRSFIGNPEPYAIRYLQPPFDIAARSIGRDMPLRFVGAKTGDEENQRHILLSGCKESETSKELRLGTKIRGALTYNLTKLLRENPNMTWKEVQQKIIPLVKRLDQEPQLRGMTELKQRKVFGG